MSHWSYAQVVALHSTGASIKIKDNASLVVSSGNSSSGVYTITEQIDGEIIEKEETIESSIEQNILSSTALVSKERIEISANIKVEDNARFLAVIDENLNLLDDCPSFVKIEGKYYSIVQIGCLCWMTENLKARNPMDYGVYSSCRELETGEDRYDDGYFYNSPVKESIQIPDGWKYPIDIEFKYMASVDFEALNLEYENVGGGYINLDGSFNHCNSDNEIRERATFHSRGPDYEKYWTVSIDRFKRVGYGSYAQFHLPDLVTKPIRFVKRIPSKDFSNNIESVKFTNVDLIDELFKNKLSISPNPNRGIFEINFENFTNEDAVIEIYNISGQQVYKSQVAAKEYVERRIDLSSQGKGLYLVKVLAAGLIKTEKIIIQ